MPRFEGDLRLFWTAMIYSPVAGQRSLLSSSSRRFAKGFCLSSAVESVLDGGHRRRGIEAPGHRLRASAPAACRAASVPRPAPSRTGARHRRAPARNRRATSSVSSATTIEQRRSRRSGHSHGRRHRWHGEHHAALDADLDGRPPLERAEREPCLGTRSLECARLRRAAGACPDRSCAPAWPTGRPARLALTRSDRAGDMGRV